MSRNSAFNSVNAKPIDFELFDKYFSYSETSPSGLVWKIDCEMHSRRHLNFRKAGDVAGNKSKNGWRVSLGDTSYYTHRVIYCIVHGEISEHMVIDHIDGDKFNNKIENIRQVSRYLNSRNKKRNSNNKTGHVGIIRCRVETVKGCYEFYRVNLIINGKKYCKNFNIKLGENIALELAIEYKKSLLDKLVDDGYSERHIGII